MKVDYAYHQVADAVRNITIYLTLFVFVIQYWPKLRVYLGNRAWMKSLSMLTGTRLFHRSVRFIAHHFYKNRDKIPNYFVSWKLATYYFTVLPLTMFGLFGMAFTYSYLLIPQVTVQTLEILCFVKYINLPDAPTSIGLMEFLDKQSTNLALFGVGLSILSSIDILGVTKPDDLREGRELQGKIAQIHVQFARIIELLQSVEAGLRSSSQRGESDAQSDDRSDSK